MLVCGKPATDVVEVVPEVSLARGDISQPDPPEYPGKQDYQDDT